MLPWLSARWWHVLVVLALVAGLIGVAGAVFGRRRERSAVTGSVDELGRLRISYKSVRQPLDARSLTVRVASREGGPPLTITLYDLDPNGGEATIPATVLQLGPDDRYALYWSAEARRRPAAWSVGDLVVNPPE